MEKCKVLIFGDVSISLKQHKIHDFGQIACFYQKMV